MTTVSGAADNTPAIESSAFQAEHLDMLKTAAETGAEVAVTENGNTLLHLAATKPKQKPSHQKDHKPVFGRDRHLLISYGDLISPIDEDWKAKFDTKWDEKLGTA